MIAKIPSDLICIKLPFSETLCWRPVGETLRTPPLYTQNKKIWKNWYNHVLPRLKTKIKIVWCVKLNSYYPLLIEEIYLIHSYILIQTPCFAFQVYIENFLRRKIVLYFIVLKLDCIEITRKMKITLGRMVEGLTSSEQVCVRYGNAKFSDSILFRHSPISIPTHLDHVNYRVYMVCQIGFPNILFRVSVLWHITKVSS